MSNMLVADFHSVTYLGWMSSNGYLATLTPLRSHLQEHSALRSLNLAVMAALSLMLCFAIFPTTNFAWAARMPRLVEHLLPMFLPYGTKQSTPT